jgi:hypothetical protein
MIQGSGGQYNKANLFKVARHGRTTGATKIISKAIGIRHFITVNKAFIALPIYMLGIYANITRMTRSVSFAATLTVAMIKSQSLTLNGITNALAKAAAFKYRHMNYP